MLILPAMIFFVDNVKFLYWEKLASYRGYPGTTKKVV